MLATVPGHTGGLKLGDTHISQVTASDCTLGLKWVPLAFIFNSQSLWPWPTFLLPTFRYLLAGEMDPLHCPSQGCHPHWVS